MNHPTQISGFLTPRIKVNPVVWGYLLAEAERDKEWAEKHKYASNPDKWPACGLSIEMLKKRLSQTIREIVEYKYAYLHLRAHLRQHGMRVDPLAAKTWEKLTGETP